MSRQLVSVKNFDNRMKTIVTKTLKKYKTSLTWASLNRYFNDCILCIYGDDLLEINEDKYKEIRKYVMSEEFHRKEMQDEVG